MAILFAGGEDTSFTFIGTVQLDAGAYGHRAGFGRTSINLNPSTADPPVNRFAPTSTFGPRTSVWFRGFVGNNGASTATNLNQQVVRFLSPDGVARILIRTDGASHLKASTRNVAGTFIDLATSTSTILSVSATVFPLDVFVNYSATGEVRCYYNGTLFFDYTGNILTDAATTLNQIEIHNPVTTQCWWSEIIIADQDTRGMGLWTLPPTASGNSQVWTPNTLANINKLAISDGTFISTPTNNALSEWTIANTPPTGTFSVYAIAQEARAQVAVTGPQHFDWVARTGSVPTDYLAGAPQAPGAAFGNFSHIWPTNPATGSAWQTSDITAAAFNLGIESQA